MRTVSAALRRPPAALAASIGFVALVLCFANPPAHAADPSPTPAKASAADTKVKVTTFPPSVQIGVGAAADSEDGSKSTGETKRHKAYIGIDSDDDFESFGEKMRQTPWLIGLIFLVVGSIFLTPVVLLVGIIWYKLRKTRLQNEAMLALAEKGVVPPGQAADALAQSAPPASVAPQLYQQAVAMRKRVAWSDLRKGVILTMIGLALSFYWLTSSGSPSWIGLILLFVGVGYVVLWWLEGRHLDQASTRAGNSSTPTAGGG